MTGSQPTALRPIPVAQPAGEDVGDARATREHCHRSRRRKRDCKRPHPPEVCPPPAHCLLS